MKKYNLYLNLNINGEEKNVIILCSDLRSIEIYLSYCEDFNHFVNTIRYTNSRKGEVTGDTIFNQDSLDLSNYISSNVLLKNPLEIEGNIPVLYKNDRDVVLSTKEDIINICGKIDKEICDKFLYFIQSQLQIREDKDLIDLIDIVYDDYEKWISFVQYVKAVVNTKLITCSRNEDINDLYRTRINLIDEISNYIHENHSSMYMQIHNNLLDVAKEYRNQEILRLKSEEAKKEGKADKPEDIDLNRNIEREEYDRMQDQKRFEESLVQDDGDEEFFDDFLGPSIPNDPRYQSIK